MCAVNVVRPILSLSTARSQGVGWRLIEHVEQSLALHFATLAWVGAVVHDNHLTNLDEVQTKRGNEVQIAC